jgi:isopenicillin-N N-acyltransferase-like protein
MAMRTVYGSKKSASNNIIVSQANGLAINFECAPDETFQVLPENGMIVHANHFQSPVALSKIVDKGVFNMPDSLYRDLRVRSLLTPYVGDITVEHVKGAFFDDFESPWSVCRPPRANFSNNQSATVAMIVMEPALGQLQIALLPALNRTFTHYSIEMEIQKPTASNAYLEGISKQSAA